MAKRARILGKYDYIQGRYSNEPWSSSITEISTGNLQINENNLGLSETPRFEHELLDYIKKYDGKELRLNFSNVERLDTSAVAALVTAKAKAKKMGMELYLQNMNDQCKQIFEIARLEKMFDQPL